MRGSGFSQRIVDAGKALLGRPICNQAYMIKQSQDVISQIGWFDIQSDQWKESRELLTKRIYLPPSAIGRVRWLLCQFSHPFGGVFTALRIADALQRCGYKNEILIYDNPAFDWQKHLPVIYEHFPALKNASFGSIGRDKLGSKLETCEYCVATFWPSTRHLLEMRDVQHKLYLIQDYEPGFYPAGTSYALAEMSYRMPFHRLCNTIGLKNYIESNYPLDGISSMSFSPAADFRYRRRPRELKSPIRVLFYSRPDTPRNAFELAFAFAKELKKQYGDKIELVAAGAASDFWEKNSKGILSWAGIMDYDSLPDFYAGFHFIVAFMLTKHPSYLPFEAMAAGCAVIANDNESNRWFLKDKHNCVLSQPTVPSLMESFRWAVQSKNYEAITHNAEKTISELSWDDEMDKVTRFFQGLHDGNAV